MNKDQVLSIIQLITTYYPNFKFKGEPKEVREDILHAWHVILVDYEIEDILKNLVSYVKRGEAYPPNVGQLLPKKEFNGPYVPNAEETRQRFLEQERLALETQKALQDPAMQENIANIKANIRKMLEQGNEG